MPAKLEVMKSTLLDAVTKVDGTKGFCESYALG